jgi:hypothetical protein
LRPAEDNAIGRTVQQQHDDALDIEDVIGKRILSATLRHNVTAREKNALAGLEVMSRFADNPKWLVVVYSIACAQHLFSGHDICSLGLWSFTASRWMPEQGRYQSTPSVFRFEFVENTRD